MRILIVAVSLWGWYPVFAQKITVGQNVHVSSSNPTWMHDEYMAQADPSHPGRLMVCSMIRSGEINGVRSGIYFSDDGGKEWRYTLDEATPAYGRVGVADPSCAFGPGGQIFFSASVSGNSSDMELGPLFSSWENWPELQGREGHRSFYRSGDGGRTWSPPLKMGSVDSDRITVDNTNSTFRGRIYLNGMYADRPMKDWMRYSVDGGKTFLRSAPTKLDPAAGNGQLGQVGSGTVLPDGTLLIARIRRMDGNFSQLNVYESINGGKHLDKSGTVMPSFDRCDSFALIGSDHSNSPFRGRAYIVWVQKLVGPGKTQSRCTAMLSHSDDKGKTWSQPVQVSDGWPLKDQQEGPDVIYQAVAVNRSGVVGVQWWDMREDKGNKMSRVRFAASLDGGKTWLPSVPVSTHQFGAFRGVRHEPTVATFMGGARIGRRKQEFSDSVVKAHVRSNAYESDFDYAMGLTADADGRFHSFWIDDRTGANQIYTAPIMVTGAVAKWVDPVASLTNITAKIEMAVPGAAPVWDAHTQSYILEFIIKNVSSNTIVGPLKLRVTKLESDVGSPVLDLGEGHLGGNGTVIDLTSALPNGKLLPGQSLSEQHLRVKIDPIGIIRGSHSVLRFDAQVFGGK